MIQPGIYSERDAIIGYIEDQLDALRSAATGLTDDQARETPCRSDLSIGGLIKHTTFVMAGRAWRRANPEEAKSLKQFETRYELFHGSFALQEGEWLVDALSAFDAARAELIADLRETDPDALTFEPPAPWFGRMTATDVTERFAMMHLIEEFARHAGHADIIREQVDGAQAHDLMAMPEQEPVAVG